MRPWFKFSNSRLIVLYLVVFTYVLLSGRSRDSRKRYPCFTNSGMHMRALPFFCAYKVRDASLLHQHLFCIFFVLLFHIMALVKFVAGWKEGRKGGTCI